MNLHDLFESALEDLPPMPDRAAVAAETVRRRKVRDRYAAVVATCALVIGAGTITLSTRATNGAPAQAAPSSSAMPTHSAASPSPTASGLDSAFAQYAVSVLQSAWPTAAVQVSQAGDPEEPSPGDFVIPLEYRVGDETYPGSLSTRTWTADTLPGWTARKCLSTPPPGGGVYSCGGYSLPAGVTMLIEHLGKGRALQNAEIHLALGLDEMVLTIDASAAKHISALQLFTLGQSPALQDLFARARQQGSSAPETTPAGQGG